MHCIANLHCRKRSLGQGNIFRSVCQEFCSQRGVPRQVLPPWTRCTPPGPGTPPQAGTPLPGRYPPGQVHPPGPGTPPRQEHPPGQVHPQDQVPPRQVHPPGPGTPPGQVHPPEQCMLGDTGNKRAVRILLECILVNCLL